jgi:hypothetical protein
MVDKKVKPIPEPKQPDVNLKTHKHQKYNLSIRYFLTEKKITCQ